MEDNFDAAEWVNEELAPRIPDEVTPAVVGESEHDLHPDWVEDHLRRYLLDIDDEE